MVHKLLAINTVPIAPNPIEGIGPWGKFSGSIGAANTQFAKLVSTIVGTMTLGAGIWFIFQLMTGAISWMSAGGDKNQLQLSQKKITSAVTGLIIVVAALLIVSLLGIILGFDILNFDFAKLVP